MGSSSGEAEPGADWCHKPEAKAGLADLQAPEIVAPLEREHVGETLQLPWSAHRLGTTSGG
jgi:hypothetical protein